MSKNEYKDIFLEEAEEQMDTLSNALLSLEDEPGDMTHLHAVFRVTHTLKSSAAFVGLNDLSDFAHKVENLLQFILEGKIEPASGVIDVLFAAYDLIKEYISLFSKDEKINIKFGGIEKEIIDLTDSAKDVSGENNNVEIKPVEENEEIVEVNVNLDFTPEELDNIYEEGLDKFGVDESFFQKGYSENKKLYYINVFLEENVKMQWVRGELIVVGLEKLGKIISSIPDTSELKTNKFERNLEVILSTSSSVDEINDACDVDQVMYVLVREIEKDVANDGLDPAKPDEMGDTIMETEDNTDVVSEDKLSGPEDTDDYRLPRVDADIEKQGDAPKKGASSKSILNQSQSVRVSIEKLDSILNLVGELAIVNSGFIEIQDRFKEQLGNKSLVGDLKEKIEALSNIAKSLQEGIMQSRMVPIGFVISRFNRLVRDLSNNLKKKVRLELRGEETELDKKIIDAIGEPLIHLVRNAIDHGLEDTEIERTEKDKDPIGTVEINAYQRGNHIMIEVSDDGRGLDVNKIAKKAIEKNLVSEADVKLMSDQQIYNLIFLPGFSTATSVTDLSGRGMGMNIVKETVEQLNGNISIYSELGAGSTFALAFPLTMAIIPALLCEAGSEVFAIPLYNVFETLKVKPAEIETIDFKEVLRVRDEVIELCRLSELVESRSRAKITAAEDKIPIIVVEFDDLRIGIVVDRLIGKREIVTKSISHYFKERELDGISGAAILGNGKIALILDVLSLVKSFKDANIINGRRFTQNKKVTGISNKEIEDEFLANEESEHEILKKLNISEAGYQTICEIFKIGIANASKNLSKFLMSNLVISAPLIRLHTIEEYKKKHFYFGKERYFICEMDFTDDAGGKFILVLDDQSIISLFSIFLGDNFSPGDEMAASSVMETTNILGAAISNTLSSALGLKIYVSTPSLNHITLEEYFGEVLQDFIVGESYIWAILASIMLDKKTLEGKIYVIPNQNTFYKINEAIQKEKGLLTFIENVIT
jgi:two-component system chemotaxis sensor kinase CheA